MFGKPVSAAAAAEEVALASSAFADHPCAVRKMMGALASYGATKKPSARSMKLLALCWSLAIASELQTP